MKTGIELIAEERSEHFTKHGRTVEMDAELNDDGQLVIAACALIHPLLHNNEGKSRFEEMPEDWDNDLCDYMVGKTEIERLIIAGSLIAAEIDRLQFINPTST